MSAIPSKTGIPDIVNTRLTNSVDFHIASTNFNSIIEKYINFVALSKYYDSLKYESDPITAEADFWEGIANANLDLQKFAKSPKATKYLKRKEMDVDDGDSLRKDDAGNPIIFQDKELGLVALTVKGKKIPLTENDSTNVNEKISKISNSFDIANEDKNGEFIAWWLDKYRKCHLKVKEILSERLSVEDTILQEISESVGFLFYQWQYPQSRYTHYADEFMQDTTPLPYNSIIDDKLEMETRTNIVQLSNRVESLFKRNMQQIINTGEVAADAHKENLVTDHYHYERLKKNQPEINENIATALGGTYTVLSWLTMNKLNNIQKIVPGVHEVVIENSKEEVDILLNKIQTLQRPFDMGILR